MKKYIGNIVCLSNNINRYLVSCFGWSDFGVIYWSGDFTEDSINTDYSRTTDTEFVLVRKSVNGPCFVTGQR